MARQMADGAYSFRAVVTTTTKYPDGRPDHEFVQYFGPYVKVGPARAQITREQTDAERWNRHRERLNRDAGIPVQRTVTVDGYVETSAITWTRV